eukprot:TRINITY_DN9220_c0_g1_i2.p1 TRINITY_DN9220_c0_g1~~TRINITY_DN9220_c0_g1_i2.p1  ORF type:complete len:385 (-),score=45.67 TRINITY_DN9220_c0_g1_i2:277-1431(-)
MEKSNDHPPVQKPPWRKILYEKQPYDDSYTDETFLACLVTNPNVVPRRYWAVVRDSAVVAQQVCAVVLVAGVAVLCLEAEDTPAQMGKGAECGYHQQKAKVDEREGLLQGALGSAPFSSLVFSFASTSAMSSIWDSALSSVVQCSSTLSAPCLLLLDVVLLCSSLILLVLINAVTSRSNSLDKRSPSLSSSKDARISAVPFQLHPSNLFSCLLFFLGLFVLSPILQTLTRSISSDTIITSTISLFLLHLFFHNYSYSHSLTPKFTGNLSLMAAIFASVLLASRLQSHASVFAFVLFSLELFVLFPVFGHHLRCLSTSLHLSCSLALVLPTGWLLSCISPDLTLAFFLSLVCLAFLCPLWLVRIQNFKLEITGPWDEAKIDVGQG